MQNLMFLQVFIIIVYTIVVTNSTIFISPHKNLSINNYSNCENIFIINNGTYNCKQLYNFDSNFIFSQYYYSLFIHIM